MKRQSTFVLSQDYLSESYDQARRYGSKWLLVEAIVGTLLLLLGLVAFVFLPDEMVLPLVLTSIGVVELLSNQIKKFFWLRRHRKSKLSNVEVEVIVDDDGLESKSPYSTSRMTWAGIEKAVRTPKGILVWPQKGMYIYFSEHLVGKETVDFIQSKVA